MIYYNEYYILFIFTVLKSTVIATSVQVTFAIFISCVFYVYLPICRFVDNILCKILVNIYWEVIYVSHKYLNILVLHQMWIERVQWLKLKKEANSYLEKSQQ